MRKAHIYLSRIALITVGVVAAAPVDAQDSGYPPSAAPIDDMAPKSSATVGLPIKNWSMMDDRSLAQGCPGNDRKPRGRTNYAGISSPLLNYGRQEWRG